MKKKKLRIAWFSPLNITGEPSGSVAAYFSDRVLPLLKEGYEIDLFYNGFASYAGFSTSHFLNAFEKHRTKPYDIFFYQLEDIKRADFIRSHIGLIPGITLFHDFLLTTHGPEPLLNSPFQDVVQKFNNPGTGWPERGREYTRSSTLAEREAALSPVSIFSNERNLDEFRRSSGLLLGSEAADALRSFYLPYPVPVPPERKRSQFSGNILFCGSVQIEHRAHKLLPAISELGARCRLTWLVDEAEKKRALDLLKEFGVGRYELVTSRSPQRFAELAADADMAVHTLFSAYGQPGPYLAISLMAGLPVIVTNFGSTGYLPDNLVFKVQAGDTESFEIRETIEAFLQGRVSDISGAVKEFAREQFDERAVADELGSIFENSAGFLAGIMERWEAMERDARRALLKEIEGLCDGDGFKSLVQPVFDELGWSTGAEKYEAA